MIGSMAVTAAASRQLVCFHEYVNVLNETGVSDQRTEYECRSRIGDNSSHYPCREEVSLPNAEEDFLFLDI